MQHGREDNFSMIMKHKNLVFGIPEVTKSSCEPILTLTMQVIIQIEKAPVDNAPSLVVVWCLGPAKSKPVCPNHPLRVD